MISRTTASCIWVNATVRWACVFSLSLLFCAPRLGAQGVSTDTLPDWNSGPVKAKIVAFVEDVTTKGDADYVPPEKRIATFDNDGTLWCEQPAVEGTFIKSLLEKAMRRHPELAKNQPYKALLAKDKTYLSANVESVLQSVISLTYAGMTQDEYAASAKQFFDTAQHPRFKTLYKNLTYRPQIELLEYLRANGFKTYICSGGTVDFMRVVSKEVYGIPPEQVIGTSLYTKPEIRNGRMVLVRTAKVRTLNDKEQKPVNIDDIIGMRPLLACGNVRSGGDIAMLVYSKGRIGPSLQLIVNHDDAAREYAYKEKDNASLSAAVKYGFTIVSMKNDWRTVFSLRPMAAKAGRARVRVYSSEAGLSNRVPKGVVRLQNRVDAS